MIDTSKLVTLKSSLDEGAKEIAEFLKDTRISLDERWNAYEVLVKAGILVSEELYGDGFVDVLSNSLTLYDDFYVERRETLQYLDMLERIMDNEDLFDQVEHSLPAWKEKVLQSGYTQFVYDW
jgi:hypothetical protein